MPGSDSASFQISAIDMLSMSILVLFAGMWINRRVAFLRDNYIPPAVTGGLIFSSGTALLHFFGTDLEFDMRFRDLLLLVFFSTVGLSARFRTLIAGGKALAVLVALSALFLIIQDTTGIGIALLTGHHPGYGLMGGSVSLAGGHGTAIAWGAEAEAAGLDFAPEVGIAFATFGLVAGGLMGGPIARFLMRRHGLRGPGSEPVLARAADAVSRVDRSEQLYQVLRTLMILAICVSLGDAVNRLLFERGVLLPGFLTSMGVAIVITNLIDVARPPLSRPVVDGFREVSLNVFLSMTMMSMQLWTIGGGAFAIVLLLILQVLAMTLFAVFIVFRLMGRDYDAAVIAAGFTGLGLGATPVAIANMDAVTLRYGPSPKALIVIPLTGAFFIDLLNATVIKAYIAMISRWFA